MSLDRWQLTIDCRTPAVLVEFWAFALGYVVQPPPDGHPTWNDYYRSVGVPEDDLDPDGDGSDRILDPSGERPGIWFQGVPEAKAVKNRLHLDLYRLPRDRPYDERRAANSAFSADLVERGASVLRTVDEPEFGRYFVVMQDPEGNEFCLG